MIFEDDENNLNAEQFSFISSLVSLASAAMPMWRVQTTAAGRLCVSLNYIPSIR